jgi:hypothetical protein
MADRTSGWRNVARARIWNRPPASAATAWLSVTPSCRPARRRSPGSPRGSAAASRSSSWVGGGSCLTRRRNPSSSRLDSAAGELFPVQAVREFDQREGIAPRFRDDLVAYAFVKVSGNDRGKQLAGVGFRQPFDGDLIDSGHGGDGFPGREHKRQRVRVDATGRERQGEQRRRIDPLRVIDKTQHGPLAGSLRQQAEHREADMEPVRYLAGFLAERDAERIGLWHGQAAGEVQHLPAQLVQRRVRQLYFRLDTADASDLETGPHRGGVVEQSGLADAGLAAEDQRSACAPCGVLDEGVDLRALPAAASQRSFRHHRAPTTV